MYEDYYILSSLPSSKLSKNPIKNHNDFIMIQQALFILNKKPFENILKMHFKDVFKRFLKGL
jgi:hypothetical protein